MYVCKTRTPRHGASPWWVTDTVTDIVFFVTCSQCGSFVVLASLAWPDGFGADGLCQK